MRIVVIGAGGHAHVIIDILLEAKVHEIVGLLTNETSVSKVLDVPRLGGDDLIPDLRASGVTGVMVAIGDNRARRRLFDLATTHLLEPVQAIHPSSVIARDVRVGRGVAIMANAVVNPASWIDDNVIINTGATVDHHARIGPDVHIAPGCHLAGHVTVGAGSLLGVGVSVIPGVRIGDGAVVGAGATILRDVPDNNRVVGPALRYLPAQKTP